MGCPLGLLRQKILGDKRSGVAMEYAWHSSVKPFSNDWPTGAAAGDSRFGPTQGFSGDWVEGACCKLRVII